MGRYMDGVRAIAVSRMINDLSAFLRDDIKCVKEELTNKLLSIYQWIEFEFQYCVIHSLKQILPEEIHNHV